MNHLLDLHRVAYFFQIVRVLLCRVGIDYQLLQLAWWIQYVGVNVPVCIYYSSLSHDASLYVHYSYSL